MKPISKPFVLRSLEPDGSDYQLTYAKSDREWINVDIGARSEAIEPPGHVWSAVARIEPSGLQLGKHNATVQLAFRNVNYHSDFDDGQVRVDIPVQFDLQLPVSVAPAQLFFGMVDCDSTSLTRKTAILTFSDDVELPDPSAVHIQTCPSEGVMAQLERVADFEFSLTVTLRPDRLPNRRTESREFLNGNVRISFDDHCLPDVDIGLIGLLCPAPTTQEMETAN